MTQQTVPVIPENAPFTPEQRSWLNGFFAGLYSRGQSPAAVQATPNQPKAKPLTILFGSQTGTAEGVAGEVAERARSQGFDPRVVDMDGYDIAQLPNEKRLLIVTSTYGDGEMPDNAQAFWETLSGADAPALKNTHFSVLALGDTNYETFCSAGKAFDERLETLGARRVHPRVDCDVDYEASCASWLEGMLPAIALSDGNGSNGDFITMNSSADAEDLSERISVSEPGTKPVYGRKNPFPAPLRVNRVLTQATSSKETRHYELALEGSGLDYQVGDALSVIPRNCPVLVEETLTALGCSGEEPVPGADGSMLELRQVLLEDYEIRQPAKELLALVAQRADDADFKALLRPEGKERLTAYLWGREIIDLLLTYPKARPSPEEFVRCLRKLQPRAYSISSSLKLHPNEVHLTVASVRYNAHGRHRKGVCSTFMADRAGEGAQVRVFPTPNKHFGVPADDGAPTIMVGPGTGVAPFRAFLEERMARGARGKNWLFFGERNRENDFFYRDELQRFQRDGILSRLELAFSRDQQDKVYVQHRMLEQARDLFGWLEEGGYFFVCGDAHRMAKDVDAALHQVVQQAGGFTAEQAAAYVNELKRDKRYVRDVY